MPYKKINKEQETIAVIYARFSSHNQREESIEQQVAECKKYAVANGIKIVEIYADSAKSGRSDHRPQFQRMQRDAKKGKFNTILAYKSNRIARNMLNAMIFENEMDQYNVRVLYAKEEFGNNAAGRFALRTMMNVNQFFSENMGEDIKRNQTDNAMNCRANGPASFGYKAGADGKFVIDEERAAIVREIFARVAGGEAFIDIAIDFNSRGIKTQRGNEWGKSSFAKIIRNERYIGVYIFDDIRIEGGMPPIISEELFYKVQKRLEQKNGPTTRNRDSAPYLLTGKLFCGECESHMKGMSGTSKGGSSHYYYVCNEQRTKGTCDKKATKRDYVEREIARGIKEYILQDDVIEWLADVVEEYRKEQKNNPELLTLQDRLSDVKISIKNMLAAIEQGIVTETTKDRLIELEAEQSKLKSNITLLKSEHLNVTRDQVKIWLESFKNGSIDDKDYQAKLFNSFLLKAYLYDDGRAKLILDVFGDSGRSIDITMPEFGASGITSECSPKLYSGSPKKREANTVSPTAIVMVRGLLVVSLQL